MKSLLPLLTATLLQAAVALFILMLSHLARQVASHIRDRRLREWAMTLIQAADNVASTPRTGQSKRIWVSYHLGELFPRLDPHLVTAAVDGVWQGLHADTAAKLNGLHPCGLPPLPLVPPIPQAPSTPPPAEGPTP